MRLASVGRVGGVVDGDDRVEVEPCGADSQRVAVAAHLEPDRLAHARARAGRRGGAGLAAVDVASMRGQRHGRRRGRARPPPCECRCGGAAAAGAAAARHPARHAGRRRNRRWRTLLLGEIRVGGELVRDELLGDDRRDEPAAADDVARAGVALDDLEALQAGFVPAPGRLRGRAGSALPARGSLRASRPCPLGSRGSVRGRGSGPGAASRACPGARASQAALRRWRRSIGSSRASRRPATSSRNSRRSSNMFAAQRPNRSRFMNAHRDQLDVALRVVLVADHVEARRRWSSAPRRPAGGRWRTGRRASACSRRAPQVEGCQPMSITPSVFVCHAALPTTVNGPPGRARRPAEALQPGVDRAPVGGEDLHRHIGTRVAAQVPDPDPDELGHARASRSGVDTADDLDRGAQVIGGSGGDRATVVGGAVADIQLAVGTQRGTSGGRGAAACATIRPRPWRLVGVRDSRRARGRRRRSRGARRPPAGSRGRARP